jgi:nucleotide-binding universal stress UspA family protein
LTLLHVVVPPEYEFASFETGGSVLAGYVAHRTERVKAELDGYLADELAGLNVKRLVVEGEPASVIVEHAHKENANLIVMPTHGYGPFRRFILGSVTAKVLHDADCPVLTGAHLEEGEVAGDPPLRSILCALDLGAQSAKTLEWAAHMAAALNARLTLIHATPPLQPREGGYFDPDWRAMLAGQAREELDRLTARLEVKPEVHVEDGEVAKVVCDSAGRFKPDLLVIGRGSSSGVFGRLRTHAYALIRGAPCAVVSV